MSSIKFFLKIFLATFLIGAGIIILLFTQASRDAIIGFFSKTSGSVLGASTKKANVVTSQLSSDIASGATAARDQLLTLRLKDLVDGVMRLQKIPQDTNNLGNDIKEQVVNFLQPKKEQKENKK